MKQNPISIHRLLFSTARHASNGAEQWFSKSKLGITPLQFGALHSIAQEGSTLNELAQRMMLRPPSILPTVDLLERRGYILRRANHHDRRKVGLIVTAKGRKILERVTGTKQSDPLSIAYRKMDSTKKKQLISLLSELNNSIQRQISKSVIT